MVAQDFQGHYAGFVSRFIAFSIDLVLIALIGLLVSTFTGMIIDFFHLDANLASILGNVRNSMEALILWFGAIFTTFFGMAYFLFFWVVAGFSPGMGLLGLRLVRVNGEHVPLGRAVLRFVGYWISALFLFIGFLWILFDRRHQGWHDKLSGTVVIYNWRQPRQA
jgi:uncharacterized RDD family membrane protein YckC